MRQNLFLAIRPLSKLINKLLHSFLEQGCLWAPYAILQSDITLQCFSGPRREISVP